MTIVKWNELRKIADMEPTMTSTTTLRKATEYKSGDTEKRRLKMGLSTFLHRKSNLQSSVRGKRLPKLKLILRTRYGK
jgi:hypothetical protein